MQGRQVSLPGSLRVGVLSTLYCSRRDAPFPCQVLVPINNINKIELFMPFFGPARNFHSTTKKNILSNDRLENCKIKLNIENRTAKIRQRERQPLSAVTMKNPSSKMKDNEGGSIEMLRLRSTC